MLDDSPGRATKKRTEWCEPSKVLFVARVGRTVQKLWPSCYTKLLWTQFGASPGQASENQRSKKWCILMRSALQAQHRQKFRQINGRRSMVNSKPNLADAWTGLAATNTHLLGHHHLDELLIIDLAITVRVGLTNHLVNLFICEFLTQVRHDVAQL